ncbi:nucleoside transporter [Candidatus Sumerlaeota bacterium]|nr:nucleoside transporter [Candidatus Sumerlaeota bacterium]
MDVQNGISFFGIFILVGIAWVFSTQRRAMNWRAVGWGVALQLLFGLFVFRMDLGRHAFMLANTAVVKVLECASTGAVFVFGPLAIGPGQTGPAGETSLGFILAFQAFPTIVFFSALVSILYYIGLMPLVIRGFSWVFTRLMGISGAESLCAASNIFVGVESALTVRPYLADMTRSELCLVLTAGMATVASNVLALYVFTLRDVFPNIAGHLVSASILSAPAAIVMAKVLLPETDTPKTLGKSVEIHYERESSLFEAVINGANSGIRLIVGIVALLLAVLGLVALVDLILIPTGGWIDGWLGWTVDWSLKGLLGYAFYPFSFIIGVPFEDVGIVSRILGERIVLTEVASYSDLAKALQEGLIQSPRSAVLATYALCGFTHVASIAIFVGGTAALAPGRTRALAQVAVRALVAATLACLMTACVAGAFYSGQAETILLGN